MCFPIAVNDKLSCTRSDLAGGTEGHMCANTVKRVIKNDATQKRFCFFMTMGEEGKKM